MEQNKWWSHFTVSTLSRFVLAEPDGDEDEGADGNEGAAGGAGGNEGAGTGGNGADDRDPQVKIKAQDEIIARLAKRDKERDAQLEELLKDKKKAEDAKLSEEDLRKKELTEAQERVDRLTAGQRKLVARNAFLESNEYDWQNPGVALRLIDLDSLEIEEQDGEMQIKDSKELKKLLDDLAKQHPYLLKSSKDEEEDEQQQGNRFVGRTGDSPKPKDKKAQEAERQKLLKKYPSLRK